MFVTITSNKTRKTNSDFCFLFYFCVSDDHIKYAVVGKSQNRQNRGPSSHKVSAKKCMTPKEINEDIVLILSEDTSCYVTVKWVSEFKRGRDGTEDDPRSYRPKIITTEEQVDIIQRIILDDGRFTVQQICQRFCPLCFNWWLPRMLTLILKKVKFPGLFWLASRQTLWISTADY